MSTFITESNIDISGFDWAYPIDTPGNTCECFVVQIDGKRFFMKKLHKDFVNNQAYRALFRKEYEKGASLSHPNVVKYESLHNSTDDCYILMENIVGETLDSFIKNRPNYFEKRANIDKFFNQLLGALNCLHENHVVHSDLKPQNIIISQVNNDVKVIDIGFCFTDSFPDSSGTTHEFSAPEHLNKGLLDVTTDIYGVGKIIEYIAKNSAKKLPRIYDQIKAKCIREQQPDRWQNIDEILTKLNKRPITKSKWSMISIAIIALLVGYIFWQKTSETIQISNDIVSVNYIKYSNFNKENKTCEAIGEDSIKNHTIYIREHIYYNGEKYKVTSIANSAFKDHKHLKTIHIPDGLESIEGDAFFGCDSILIINIPNSVTEIGENAFYGCKGATELILSQNLKEIPTAGFVATKLSRLNIPEGIEVIKLDAFAHCSDLTDIIIPSTLKHLERGVFYNCIGLESIELSAGLEQTDEYLFFGCDNLKDIYIKATVPPRALALHRNPSQITLHVPAQSVEAYRNAPHWQEMNIVAIED